MTSPVLIGGPFWGPTPPLSWTQPTSNTHKHTSTHRSRLRLTGRRSLSPHLCNYHQHHNHNYPYRGNHTEFQEGTMSRKFTFTVYCAVSFWWENTVNILQVHMRRFLYSKRSPTVNFIRVKLTGGKQNIPVIRTFFSQINRSISFTICIKEPMPEILHKEEQK